MQPFLESVEYHPVGALNLAIGPRVSDGDIPNIDPAGLAVLPELVAIEVGAQICDDAVGEAIAVHDLIQEVEYSVGFRACNRLDLDPLGELVDSHQNSIESSWRC